MDRPLFIDGRACAAADGRTLPAIDPATGQAFGSIARGGPIDVDRAIARRDAPSTVPGAE